ncbi:HPP family protein [Paraburkholderia tropica]|uniref:HPP family protein n=1 Tax=Paraburkholderia tropica TaxID=92647 RepID=UPI002AB2837D|nr:HPP family protein [Paraburkholderia tropica]
MSRTALLAWLRRFRPHPAAPSWREGVRRAAGALVGIAVTGVATHLVFGGTRDIPMLVAPMGASAVLLFGASESPLAQPWSILGGNFVSALVGVACARWIGVPVAAAAVAVALAICAMFACRCVHPPSGAVALTAVLGGPSVHALGFGFVATPIAFQSMALLGAALCFHALTGHRYPRDVVAALASARQVAQHAAQQAAQQAKTFDALTCEDVMTAADHAVPLTMARHAAWERLHRHGAHALPVVDEARRVVGVVTHRELAARRPEGGVRLALGLGLGQALWRVLRRRTLEMEETVEAVMAAGVHAVHRGAPLASLVPIFADHAYYEVPVLDDARRLVGVVRHSDMIRWLHRHAGAASLLAQAG